MVLKESRLLGRPTPGIVFYLNGNFYNGEQILHGSVLTNHPQ